MQEPKTKEIQNLYNMPARTHMQHAKNENTLLPPNHLLESTNNSPNTPK